MRKKSKKTTKQSIRKSKTPIKLDKNDLKLQLDNYSALERPKTFDLADIRPITEYIPIVIVPNMQAVDVSSNDATIDYQVTLGMTYGEDVTVKLSSFSSQPSMPANAINLPQNVTVPGGARWATFKMKITSRTSQFFVTVTAGFNNPISGGSHNAFSTIAVNQ